jgi:uncharacterized delta-60 repeat protein
MGVRKRAWISVAGASAMAAVALAAGGDLDATFGTDGIAQFGPGGNWVADCEVQSDGRIVYGGPEGSTSNRWRIERRLSDGSADTSWGSGGSVSIQTGGALTDLALDTSGRILAVGRSSVTTTSKGKTTTSLVATVKRLSSSGAVEFTTDVAVPGSGSALAKAVALDSSGRILVAGEASFTSGKGNKAVTQTAVFVARLTSAGALDTSFGSSGITVNDVTAGDDRVYAGAMALQSDGKIVVGGGHTQIVNGVGHSVWDVTRYNANGGVDSAFGTLHGPGATDVNLAGLTVDVYDRIVAVGARWYATNVSDMLAVRWGADGAIDTSFGSDGAAVVHNSDRSMGGYPSMDSSGRIVFLGGVAPNAPTSFELALVTVRLTSDGALDEAYGSGGVTEPLVLGRTVDPRALALGPGGKIVVAGDAYDSSSVHTWFLARYDAD